MATDPEIEFGAAQGADTDTIALSGYLDGALGLAARFQMGKPGDVHHVYSRSPHTVGIQSASVQISAQSIFGALLHLNRLSRGPDCNRHD
jgi:hypothetical protein